MSNIHFVHDNEPGTPLDNEQIRALRSHVRKVNLERLQQRTTERMENFRSLSIDDFSQHGEIKPEKRRFPVRPKGPEARGSSSNVPGPSKRLPLPGAESLATLADSEGLESLSHTLSDASSGQAPAPALQSSTEDDMLRSTTTRHPYSAQVSVMTGIDEILADSLLRSGPFLVATEPLFTAEHQSLDLMNLSIFPDLLESQAFLSALVYSMIRSDNTSESINESLHFKGRAIEYLQDDLHKNGSAHWTLAICTILVLCGVARRSGEISEYTAHAEGLDRLVRLCHSSQVQLPADVLRAVLWLGLTGAGILGHKRRFCEADFPALFNSDIDIISSPGDTLPYGFAFHVDMIHHDLLPCVQRVKGLQTAIATGSLEPIEADNVRASIISSLVSLQQACQAFGPISEGCRVAAYIVCDAAINGPGQSSFVGWRLSGSLIQLLAETSGSEIWAYRRDLLLWLVLIGASASWAEGWAASAVSSAYESIMARLLHDASTWAEEEEGSLVLLSAVQGYIYNQDWLNNRHLIPHWTDLESLLTQSGLLNAEAIAS
ncbi:hypothetical protein LTR10_015190 [Elasticomyces elasticus]|uniref:Transcription factor domain-containing protein n=1 Tax=Exophiala sideris TaxID=1016849 RepID=A0ABR0JE28_9EURO|nr:hypothetical protein LTR10_015190 [Elasticomyces elasticus]KAK5032664.1 hypothetical protein LTS07_004074 [Exophiala sideris]KAK5037155.1 hypothetical protein LTR13_004960 [Exophiala sideris]KAK5062189.1 hypothetical protein LTR69_004547 [Exophiala sideris]KAK5182313.1 hypothetical protein LTR44_005324 [Eurotiomycetes sp. CCFEE 6388]